jgi:gentisate 1,2-dioxygenase
MSAPKSTPEYDAARTAWQNAKLSPLWESAVAFKEQAVSQPALHWPWSVVRPLIDQAIASVSPSDVERRVLLLSDPVLSASRRATTTKGLNAGYQVLLPGESARPHRHSMDAIRFILEGEGAVTVVNGKECPMAEGDLVLTPGWTWHEHMHRGTRPIIWLDGLNSPLHRYLGTAAFEPGPAHEIPATIPDTAFVVPSILPETGNGASEHSPVFHYSHAVAKAAVAAAPKGRDGARRVRYVNPTTGGGAIALLDLQMVELDSDAGTIPFRTTSNAICAVVEGAGESRVGDQQFRWGPKDVFTLPQGNWIVHRALGGRARLFVYSDKEVFARLGLLKEEYGNT